MTGVRCSPKSRADLRRLFDTIAVHDPDAALRVVEAIEQRGNWLSEVPFGGAAIRGTELRSLTVIGLLYTIVYRLKVRSASVVRVHHQSQNWRPQ